MALPQHKHVPETVQAYLDRYAKALTSGDVKTLVTMWQVPALVLSDDMIRAVSSAGEIDAFFTGAKDQYHQRGITDTRGEIEREEWVTDRMCIVDVTWPYLDAQGKILGAESSTYTLRRDEHGDLRMCVALMRGAAKKA